IGHWIAHALGPSPARETGWVIATFAFFWIMFDVAVVVTGSVHGALVNDVVPREVIGRFFGLFRVVSLGAGMLFNYFLLGEMKDHYVSIFFVIGLLYLICFMAMCLLVKEGDYPPPPPPIEGGALARLGGAL